MQTTPTAHDGRNQNLNIKATAQVIEHLYEMADPKRISKGISKYGRTLR
jgi:hypothetical protein